MRVLLLAEAANPEWTSVPLVGFNQAMALRRVVDVHLVTQVRNRDALVRSGLRDGADFTAIDSEPVARPLHELATIVGLGRGGAWSFATAAASVAYLYFERLVRERFAEQLRGGAFDVVHRLTPVSPATPSPIARWCAREGVPFVLGPINGGLPWPKGFLRERIRERELWSAFRGLRGLLPGASSTLRNAALIVAGSRAVVRELPKWAAPKTVLLSENGIFDEAHPAPAPRARSLPLEFAFAGRLVPCKGLELGLRGLAPLAREGKARISIYGEGPERARLEALAGEERIAEATRFHGWLAQSELFAALKRADVFLFPSIREFGGGALLEAMASGLHPIVADYGGPPEICGSVGDKIPLGGREEMARAIGAVGARLCGDPEVLNPLAQFAWRRAMELSWDSKARFFAGLYERVVADKRRTLAV